MHLSIQQLNQLSDIALNTVLLAGHYIETVDKSRLNTQLKDSGSTLSSQVVTEVDLKSQAIIIEQLQSSCEQYDIALLSEENCADVPINEHTRFSKDYFWCIDPLDGTLPFVEGRTGYAVSIALVTKNGTPIISAIYLPATSTSYQTKIDSQNNATVYKNGQMLSSISNAQQNVLTVYCDQSFIGHAHYKPLIDKLTELLEQFNLQSINVISGSGAVVNALSVIETPFAIYIKLPKQQPGGGALWDFSGTACIAQALNGWVSDAEGLRLDLNQTDSYYMNKRGVIFSSHNTLAIKVIEQCKGLSY